MNANMRKFEDALADAEFSIKYRPKWFKSHLRKATALYGLNELDAALDSISDALSMPDSSAPDCFHLTQLVIKSALDAEGLHVPVLTIASEKRQKLLLALACGFVTSPGSSHRVSQQPIYECAVWSALLKCFPSSDAFIPPLDCRHCTFFEAAVVPFLSSQGLASIHQSIGKLCNPSTLPDPSFMSHWAMCLYSCLQICASAFRFYKTFSRRLGSSSDIRRSIPKDKLKLFETACADRLAPQFQSLASTCCKLVAKSLVDLHPHNCDTFADATEILITFVNQVLSSLVVDSKEQEALFLELFVYDGSLVTLLTLHSDALQASTARHDLFRIMEFAITAFQG